MDRHEHDSDEQPEQVITGDPAIIEETLAWLCWNAGYDL